MSTIVNEEFVRGFRREIRSSGAWKQISRSARRRALVALFRTGGVLDSSCLSTSTIVN